WASGVMSIELNGTPVAQGLPGRYVTLDRAWSNGDVLSFRLPMGFKLTCYEGADQVAGRERYALEYGPLLMAALDTADSELSIVSDLGPTDLVRRLKPVADQPLHFVLSAEILEQGARFIPYFEVNDESFSCFPIIKSTATKTLFY